MRRLGAILIMLGTNIAVGSLVAAFWMASLECAMDEADDTCKEGAVVQFINLMTSVDGLIYWGVVVVGGLVFWWGQRMRGKAS
ncbi:hypothetical protein L1889_07035 [Paenalcaligenes niemegkensis]|uniref:hypothetical protein n=1 Tax=Paenalcaligenes niemegkensis TaxID=2895469 RepID=UPI001EE7ADD2|nr:hypothetical protein [Paenalcaligenes niemegkensis]MCQ9616493.1 hypothetical protein [Paenalcaligenes niemegkensis]